jgi:uncharacterized protein YjbI with pentapeptide repeats
MAEGKGTPTSEQKQEHGKRPPRWKRFWGRGSEERTLQRKPWTLREFWGKTVWDWLELLIVPVVVAIFGLVFSAQQDARQRELEEQRAQDAALQAYLDQMSTLLIENNLLEAKESDPVYTLAQARTATVIAGLDAEHNRSVIRFLTNSGLTGNKESSISLLRDIDLPRASLSDANLSGADLSDADLSDANLSGTDLSAANLRKAQLFGTDLSGALLLAAFLERANLTDANLSGAALPGAHLHKVKGVTQKHLEQQASELEGAIMPDGSKHP